MKRFSAGTVAAGIASLLIVFVMAPVVLGLRFGEQPAAGPVASPLTPPADAQPVSALTVDIWFLSAPREFTDETIFAESLLDTGEGYFLAFDEQGLNDYVRYWFADDFLEHDANIREAALRLRPGTVSLQAEVNMRVGWQPVELVFQLNPDQTTLSFAGAWVGEQFYTTAPGSYLQNRAAELEDAANRALTDVSLLHPQAGERHIERIYIGEGFTQIVFR